MYNNTHFNKIDDLLKCFVFFPFYTTICRNFQTTERFIKPELSFTAWILVFRSDLECMFGWVLVEISQTQ